MVTDIIDDLILYLGSKEEHVLDFLDISFNDDDDDDDDDDNNNCRDVESKSPLSIYVLGLWPSRGLKLFEEGKSWLEETVLLNKKVSFGHNGSRGWAEDKHLLD